ncbi:MAG: bifunctional oligoribonuclease/PAP phosphatase NrnA, partial [Muribaculaceae bacterium]|nr:bifunctional oligoribonuclease/PAP phosphatase NrnA [Muribaculaceae bacterium]
LGADKEKIIQECVKACSYESLRLKSFAISEKMEVFARHRGILISLSKEDLERFHYEKGDTEGLVNMPLDIRGIVFSIFIREDAEQIKISARSKYDFPVSKICSDLFGGGGHIQAAGAEFKGSLEECRRMIIEALPKYDSYLPSHLERIDWRNN